MKDYCLGTGHKIGCASFGSGCRLAPAAGNPTLPHRLAQCVSAAKKFRLRLTVEFLIAVAFLGDLLVVFGGLCVGFWIRFQSPLDLLMPRSSLHAVAPGVPSFMDCLSLFAAETIFLLAAYAYLHFYSRSCFTRFLRTAKVIILSGCFWLSVFVAFSLILVTQPSLSRLAVALSIVCASGAMLLWRYVFYRAMGCETFAASLQQRILFVGWSKEAEQFEQEILRDQIRSCQIVGCLPSSAPLAQSPPPHVPLLGEYRQLPALLEQRRADMVILADAGMNTGEIIKLADLCETQFVQFKVIPSYFQVLASGLRLETVSGVPVLGVCELPLDRFANRVLKRVLDIAGAIVGLMVSAPLIAVFGALVYRESPGPIFYRQIRIGRNGRPFKMLKIRSLKLGSEPHGQARRESKGKPSWWVKENDPRLLKIGAFIRKSSIDELPQFWNVLKGEMSLVGPRPELPEGISILESTVPHYHARHTCLPGITGWAQVNGWRGDTSLEQRIRHDLWYVEHWSLAMDLRILTLTLGDCILGTQRNAY